MSAPAAPATDRVLWHPERWMLWAFAGLLVYAAVLLSMHTIPALFRSPAALFVGLAANGIAGLILFWAIYHLDLFRRLEPAVLAVAFVWGFAAAPAFAGEANAHIGSMWTDIGVEQSWQAALSGPMNEEILKGLGVLAILVIVRDHIRRPLDGFIYGAMAGLGFELAENLLYSSNAATLDPNDDVSGAINSVETRLNFIAGLGAHAVFTGISGLGMGYAFSRRERTTGHRVGVALGLFALAFGLHFMWDAPLAPEIGGDVGSLVSGVIQLLKAILLYGSFVVAYRLAIRPEWDWFAHQAEQEPPDVITAEEAEGLRTWRGRRRARRSARKQGGRGAGKLMRKLQRAQLRLVGGHDGPAGELERRREEARSLRGRLAEAT